MRSARRLVKGDLTELAPFAKVASPSRMKGRNWWLRWLERRAYSRLLRRSRRQDRRHRVQTFRMRRLLPLSCIRIARASCVKELRRPTCKSSPLTLWQLPFGDVFDRVLADVPCSGTGTLARNPEIKWKLRPEDLIGSTATPVGDSQSGHEACGTGGRVSIPHARWKPRRMKKWCAMALDGQCFIQSHADAW